MTTALSSPAAVLSHLQASGFTVTADRRGLWVRPRAHLTLEQITMIELHRDELVALVTDDVDLLRAMLAKAREKNDMIAKDVGRWIKVAQQAGDRAREAEARAEVAEIQARIADMIARRAQQTASIPDELIGTLIRLCHPDKHGGSEAANRATAWLLQQRKN